MEWYESLSVMIGIVLVLMSIGAPVAFAFLGANIVGVFVFMGPETGPIQLIDNLTSIITNFTFVAVPLFIFMGTLFFHTGLAIRVFDALDMMFGRIPGRLSYITIAGGATFATLTGSSSANTAMLGSLMVPEMARRGYAKHMSMGPVLGCGGLAMIIPPSTLAIILGTVARIDVAKILIAGLIPGLLLALLYAGTVFLQVKVDPTCAPSYAVGRHTLSKKLKSFLFNVMPMGLIVVMVVGFILGGIATPSEAAAFGVLGVFVLVLAFRSFSVSAIKRSLVDASQITGMLFLIVAGSSTFSQILAFSGASSGMLEWAAGTHLPNLLMLLIIFLILLAMGMFMDGLSVMLLTVPIFFPLVAAMGYDQIWFGIVVLLAIEMSLSTPPFGILLFVMMGVAPSGTRMSDVVRSALPYLGCDALLVCLLVIFPSLALYLPSFLR